MSFYQYRGQNSFVLATFCIGVERVERDRHLPWGFLPKKNL